MSPYHRDQLSQICDVLDVQGAQTVRRDEEQRHVHAAVVEARGGVAALALVLVGQVDGALLPDVLQDGLLGALQRVVPCRTASFPVSELTTLSESWCP